MRENLDCDYTQEQPTYPAETTASPRRPPPSRLIHLGWAAGLQNGEEIVNTVINYGSTNIHVSHVRYTSYIAKT